MKKIVLMLTLAVISTVTAYAQFAYPSIPEGALKRKGGVMKTVDKTNKVKLSSDQVAYILSDIEGVDYNDEWNELNRNRKKGVGLIVGGSIAAGTGAVVFLGAALVEVIVFVLGAPLAAMDESGESMEKFEADLNRQFAPWYIGSGIVAGAGTACLIAGIPTTVKYGKKMNAIVNHYNESHAPAASLPEVTLNFGRTANGVGLTLNF